MEDYYTIQTPEHHSSLFTQLHALQKQGVMCDVILAAEDGEVMAHKVILMAVSKYFREKLSPVISATATRIFLKGIPVIELANLVKYIYTGKLLIAKETMDITLEVAEILQLNGVINGYKEILAYEHLKGGQSSEDSKAPEAGRVVKRDTDSYNDYNIQVQHVAEIPVTQEQQFTDSGQSLTQTGFQDVTEMENAATTETVSSVPVTSLNTSNEYSFETNLFEDQYYDVGVGSNVNIQSDSQVNTLPTLQKMTCTMSSENQSQHQDLLSVAIETLTDANYLSSTPSKELRNVYTTLANQVSTASSSISGAETTPYQSQPLETQESFSATPTAMVVNATTSLATDHIHTGSVCVPEDEIPPAQKYPKGQIPVYRVSIPQQMAVTEHKGQLQKTDSEKKRGRPSKNTYDEALSAPARTSRSGRLIVSPVWHKSPQRNKENGSTTEDAKRKLILPKKKSESPILIDKVNAKSNAHLDKVVEDLKIKVSEAGDGLAKSSENSEIRAEPSKSGSVEDFGQCVNFDSDDDDSNGVKEIVLNGDIEKIVDRLESSTLPVTKEKAVEQELNLVKTTENKGASEKQDTEKELTKGKAGWEQTIICIPDVVESTENRQLTTEEDQGSVKETPKTKVDSEAETAVHKTKSYKPSQKPIEMVTRGKESKSRQQQLPALDTDTTPEKTTTDKGTKSNIEDSDSFETPKGKGQDTKDTDSTEEGGSNKEDTRSSASKRKTKAPRRLTDNSRTKTSLNENIPMTRTRRYSKNEGNKDEKSASNDSAVNVKKNNNKAEKIISKKSKETEKTKIDLAIPVTGKETSKRKLQPVVKLTKQSREEIMSMAREIAASRSPKKRKVEKIEVEIETDTIEPIKKKSRKPTEQTPVSSLKNRQKSDDSDEAINNDDDDNDDESYDDYEEMEYPLSPEEETVSREDSIDGTPTPIVCKHCKKTFKYQIQLNKHSKYCKRKRSVIENGRNIFTVLQDGSASPEVEIIEDRSRCGTPESVNSVTFEIIPFNKADRESFEKLSKADKDGSLNGKLYICQEKDCNFTTESPSDASKHQNTHKVKKACTSCGMFFTSEVRFRDHQCDLVCTACNLIFETKKDLASHIKTKHKTKGKKDEKDGVKQEADGIKVKKRRRERVGRERVEKIFKCFICEEVFSKKTALKEHQNNHDLTCSCCNVKFQNMSRYKVHMTSQKRRSVELVCTICNKSFARRTDQRKHMFKFHGKPIEGLKKELKTFQCNICSFVTWSQRLLDIHMKAHSGLKDVPCPECKKMFLNQYDVNRHVNSVHGKFKGRYKCGEEGCDFSTAQMRSLKQHIQLKHTKDMKNLFLCQFCDYKASLKGNLDKHIRAVHKLNVVSKSLLKDRDKYSKFKRGTIITKDGKEATEDDVKNYNRPSKQNSAGTFRLRPKPSIIRKKAKTIEEFTREVMARHMKRLEAPVVEKDYRSAVLDKAINQPSFPHASSAVRNQKLAQESFISRPRLKLHYDQINPDEALQYAIDEDVHEFEEEVIVDDGIVPLPSTGMYAGNEVYIIEAGKSENIIETPDFSQPFVENDYEDETTRSLRVLTNSNENEDETSRSLRVLTTLLEAGQHA